MRSLSLRLLLPKLGATAFIGALTLLIPSDFAPVLSSGNISDVAAMTTSNPPAMYEVRAFNFQSVCSAHPVYGD